MKDLDQLIEQLEVVLVAFHSAMDTPEIPDTKGARAAELAIHNLFAEACDFLHQAATKAKRAHSLLFEIADGAARLEPSVREAPSLIQALYRSRLMIAEESNKRVEQPESNRERPKTGRALRFGLPPGANWDNVSIQIVSERNAVVKVRDKQEPLSFTVMGFEDHRKKDPNKLWSVMIQLAIKEGRFAREKFTMTQWRLLQTDIQRLNRCLKEFFGIEGRPITFNRRDRSYVAAFKIEANPEVLE